MPVLWHTTAEDIQWLYRVRSATAVSELQKKEGTSHHVVLSKLWRGADDRNSSPVRSDSLQEMRVLEQFEKQEEMADHRGTRSGLKGGSMENEYAVFLDRELWLKVKEVAASQGMTTNEFVKEAIEDFVAEDIKLVVRSCPGEK